MPLSVGDLTILNFTFHFSPSKKKKLLPKSSKGEMSKRKIGNTAMKKINKVEEE